MTGRQGVRCLLASVFCFSVVLKVNGIIILLCSSHYECAFTTCREYVSLVYVQEVVVLYTEMKGKQDL